MNRAITFTLGKRPFYTGRVLEGWRKVRGIEKYEVSFHIEPFLEAEAQVRQVENFMWALHSDAIEYQINDRQYDVLGNPLKALRYAFSNPDIEYAILAEEDVEVGTDVLECIEAGLEHAPIACAWSQEDGPEDELVLRKWFNPWCWGMSREVFESILEPSWDVDYGSKDGRGPGGWDNNIGLRLCHDLDFSIAFPRASRSRHIGKYLGAHLASEDYGKFDDNPASFRAERPQQMWRLA